MCDAMVGVVIIRFRNFNSKQWLKTKQMLPTTKSFKGVRCMTAAILLRGTDSD